MQREDRLITNAPAPLKALQPDINRHSISRNDPARTQNKYLKYSNVDIKDLSQWSTKTSNNSPLEAEHGWDVYPDQMT